MLTDKRQVLIDAGYGDADRILNALHQAGWKIVPKEQPAEQARQSESLVTPGPERSAA